MKKIILLVVASLIIYGCAKEVCVNVVGNAVVKQQAVLANI